MSVTVAHTPVEALVWPMENGMVPKKFLDWDDDEEPEDFILDGDITTDGNTHHITFPGDLLPNVAYGLRLGADDP